MCVADILKGNQKELVKQKPLSQKPSLGTGQERRGLTSRAIPPPTAELRAESKQKQVQLGHQLAV